jgi:hypothetical protein
MSAPAAYDLNEVFDALEAVLDGTVTGDELSGEVQTITVYSEVARNVQVPAIVLELDDVAWDQNMGDGADNFTVMMTVLVQDVETEHAQRTLRSFLSRKPDAGLARIKAKLDDAGTLGGLISYVQMGAARQMGRITYDQVDYLGVAIPLEVVS